MSRVKRFISITLGLLLWACKKTPPPPRFPELPDDSVDLPEEDTSAHL
jgi:hypothetical protein